MFQTTSRRLEEFLHVHLIRWVSQDKDEYGDTQWTYEDTEELRRVVVEFKSIMKKDRRLSNAEVKTFGGKVYRKPYDR